MNRSGLLVMMLAGVLAAACTTETPGEPRDTTTPSASTPAAGGPSITLPPRPRELRLDGLDPCALIPKADYPTFYIEKPGKRQQNEQNRSPECLYLPDYGTAGVTLVVTEGIGNWLNGSRAGVADEVEPVAGFPAISIALPGRDTRCDIAVDVADGQYLWAVIESYVDINVELPEPCEFAHQLAESAMSTLVDS